MMLKQAFTELGQSWDLSEDLFWVIEKVSCSFYSSGTNASDVNDLRYNFFFAKNGEIESHQLLPCKDCHRQHTRRANYQARIWRRSLQCSPSIHIPVVFGWKMGAQRKTNQVWQLTGWMESLLPRQRWSFLHADVPDRADFQTVFNLNGECPNMYTDLCWLQDCEN